MIRPRSKEMVRAVILGLIVHQPQRNAIFKDVVQKSCQHNALQATSAHLHHVVHATDSIEASDCLHNWNTFRSIGFVFDGCCCLGVHLSPFPQKLLVVTSKLCLWELIPLLPVQIHAKISLSLHPEPFLVLCLDMPHILLITSGIAVRI